MKRYQLPKYFALETDPINKKILRDYDGEIRVRFGDGPLVGQSYDPFGVLALWSLVGTVASLGDAFNFEVKLGTRFDGFHGGFADGKFCLFEDGKYAVDILTRHKIELAGSRRVVFKDPNHELEYWIPEAAMISFDEMLSVGNAALLSPEVCIRTPAYKMWANWDGDIYRD